MKSIEERTFLFGCILLSWVWIITQSYSASSMDCDPSGDISFNSPFSIFDIIISIIYWTTRNIRSYAHDQNNEQKNGFNTYAMPIRASKDELIVFIKKEMLLGISGIIL